MGKYLFYIFFKYNKIFKIFWGFGHWKYRKIVIFIFLNSKGINLQINTVLGLIFANKFDFFIKLTLGGLKITILGI